MDSTITNLPGALQQLLVNFISFLPNLIASLVIFIFSLYLAGWLGRVINRWLKKRDTGVELTRVVETIARWIIYILGATTALNQVGFDLTAFLTGLGILGFTVGFAIQDVSKNFVAGLLLLIDRPFDIGDSIEVKGFGGTVVEVELRATEIRTFDGRIVQIPNSDVFTSPIINFSRADRRRIPLTAGVAYGTDLDEARRIALETISAQDGVLPEPPPQLVYSNFGGSTIDFTLYYWVDTRETGYFTAQDAGIVALDRAFSAAQIEMPYPIQTVINK